jgi:uncharacterized protein (TIGR04562 family)
LNSFLSCLNRLKRDQWGILNVLIADSSPIDLPKLAITDARDAYHFILNYGYDLRQTDDAEDLEKIRYEALDFIQTYFIETLNHDEYEPLKIPEVFQATKLTDLLIMASGNPRTLMQRWACAILRVMHTLAHIVNDLSANFLMSIQEQILNPYYQHLQIENHQIILGRELDFQIPLVDFQVKAGKDRDSALLKLLHKRENVAADIFDRMGVRFVTRDRLDALLVLKFLREHHLVTFANVKPSRSVNTLLDLEKFKRGFTQLYRRFEQQELSLSEIEKALRLEAQHKDSLSHRQIQQLFNRNPHTSKHYRSIQFTVRHLVRVASPLAPYMEYVEPEKLPNRRMKEGLKKIRPYYRFFFPYEVQIVDEYTHQNNLEGQASHETYKLKQLMTARERVIGSLLKSRELPV